MLKDADEQVAEGGVVLSVFEHVALVFEAAASEEDGQVFTGMSGGVAEVAGIEHDGVIEERLFTLADLLHAVEELAEEFDFGLFDEGKLFDLGLILSVM